MTTDEQVAQVRTAIEPLRQSLQLDGADIAVVRVDGSTAEFVLDLSNASCKECVLPKDMLEQALLLTIRKSVSGIAAVTVQDPRQAEV